MKTNIMAFGLLLAFSLGPLAGGSPVPSTRGGGPISPSEAALMIASAINGCELAKNLGSRQSREVSRIVDRVSWPDATTGIPVFSKDADRDAQRPEVQKLGGWDYARAVGLVCAAWDVHLGRPQYVQDWVCLACSDKRATLVSGERWPRRSSY